MAKVFLENSVYDATQKRLEYVFSEFENVIIAFSGGKDSGVLLNLVMDYIEAHNLRVKPILYHQDFEVQYTATTKYLIETFEHFKDRVEPYWFCLPLLARNALGNSTTSWIPWDDEHPELWIRQRPNLPYVYHLGNNPVTTYKYRMKFKSFIYTFARWIKATHGGGNTVTLLGLRADESLSRYCSVAVKKCDYNGKKWITTTSPTTKTVTYNASPIYDWTFGDVWAAIANFHYSYNSLYDLYYKAGLDEKEMRIATSIFYDDARFAVNLYKTLDPTIWEKVVSRMAGANSAALYGRSKAAGYKGLDLPPGHTWESYANFLLSTLPDQVKHKYIKKAETIGGNIEKWRNLCVCILKNDHNLKHFKEKRKDTKSEFKAKYSKYL